MMQVAQCNTGRWQHRHLLCPNLPKNPHKQSPANTARTCRKVQGQLAERSLSPSSVHGLCPDPVERAPLATPHAGDLQLKTMRIPARCLPLALARTVWRPALRMRSEFSDFSEDPKIDTILAAAGSKADTQFGGMSPPLHFATTFERDADFEWDGPQAGLAPGFSRQYVYSRLQHPTRATFEDAMAKLEGAAVADLECKGQPVWSSCVAFASGQAAAAALLHAAGPQTRLLLAQDVYHGVRYLVRQVYSPWGLKSIDVDPTDLSLLRKALEDALSLESETFGPCDEAPVAMVWVESPSNPLLQLVDIEAIAKLARELEEERGGKVIVVVDSTWQTPILCRALSLGADVVLHSLTKYIGGHSDLLGGALVIRTENDAEPLPFNANLLETVRTVQTLIGSGLSPMDSWLALRGMRSLKVRVQQQCETAMAVARFLDGHERVEVCHYPGLPSHPQHQLAKKQMGWGLPDGVGFGAMVSFEISGDAAEAIRVVGNLKMFGRATSLGGTESLAEHRRSVEGQISETPASLVRLSIGLEDQEDLIGDLRQALTRD